MTVQKIERSLWERYFDDISRVLTGKQVEIKNIGLDIGDQVEVNWTPLRRLRYHADRNLFEVDTGTRSHMIGHPREIYVEIDGSDLQAVEVLDGSSHKHVIALRTGLEFGEGE